MNDAVLLDIDLGRCKESVSSRLAAVFGGTAWRRYCVTGYSCGPRWLHRLRVGLRSRYYFNDALRHMTRPELGRLDARLAALAQRVRARCIAVPKPRLHIVVDRDSGIVDAWLDANEQPFPPGSSSHAEHYLDLLAALTTLRMEIVDQRKEYPTAAFMPDSGSISAISGSSSR